MRRRKATALEKAYRAFVIVQQCLARRANGDTTPLHKVERDAVAMLVRRADEYKRQGKRQGKRPVLLSKYMKALMKLSKEAAR